MSQDAEKDLVGEILLQHSRIALGRSSNRSGLLHECASHFMKTIQEENRRAEDEIIQRAVSPENKEK